MDVQLDAGQQRFVDGVAEHSHPVVCMNVAGGGKSTTLAYAYRQLAKKFAPKDILVACLNVHNSKDLEKKLPDANILRYNQLSWRAVAKGFDIDKRLWENDERKYLHLVTKFAMNYYGSNALTQEQWQTVETTEAVRSMCHNTLTNPLDFNAVKELALDYCIVIDEEFVAACLPRVFEWGRVGLQEPYMGSYWSIKERYTYNEVMYLAATEPSARFWRHKVVLTDERQDCNAAQSKLLERVIWNDGYCHSLGDPDQQLYLFAGSDIHGWTKLLNVPGTEVVNSPISYRCSRAVVEMAKEYVPRIEAWPGARDGRVHCVKRENLTHDIDAGHVFLSRTNADSIQTALRCIGEGKRALVKGRDIGVNMIQLVDNLATHKGYTFDDLLVVLRDWRNQQIAILKKKFLEAEREIENIIDRAKSLEALYIAALRSGVNNDGTFRIYIERLFTTKDDQDTSEVVLCSTIHKFKGFQAENVWVQESDLCPGKKAKTIREIQQDLNAAYVAITRSQDSIYLVKDTGSYA